MGTWPNQLPPLQYNTVQNTHSKRYYQHKQLHYQSESFIWAFGLCNSRSDTRRLFHWINAFAFVLSRPFLYFVPFHYLCFANPLFCFFGSFSYFFFVSLLRVVFSSLLYQFSFSFFLPLISSLSSNDSKAFSTCEYTSSSKSLFYC